MAVFNVDWVEYLPMSSEFTTAPVYTGLSQVLSFTDSFTNNQKAGTYSNSLTLYSQFVVSNAAVSRTFSNALNFQDRFRKQAYERIWYNHIAFEDKFGFGNGWSDTLTFTESWVGISAQPIDMTLVFGSTFAAVLFRNRNVEDTIDFQSTFFCTSNNVYVTNIPLPTLGGPNAPEC